MAKNSDVVSTMMAFALIYSLLHHFYIAAFLFFVALVEIERVGERWVVKPPIKQRVDFDASVI